MITVLVPTYTPGASVGLRDHEIVSIVAFQYKAVAKRANGVSDRVMLLKKRSRVIAIAGRACGPPPSAEGVPTKAMVHASPAIRQIKGRK